MRGLGPRRRACWYRVGELGNLCVIVDPHEDAFGRALLDCHEQKPVDTLMLEMDDGWRTPAMAPTWFFNGPQAWAPWEQRHLARIQGPVLDLGAGAGRASLYLRNRGLEVTAVDNSPGAVEVCRRRGIRDVRLLDLTRELPADRRWKAILLLCGNLGLAGGWDATRGLLGRLAEVTDPAAVLLADTVDPTVMADEHAKQYQRKRAVAGDYVGEVTLRLHYGRVASPWFVLSNILIEDVARLVRGTGWSIGDHFVGQMDHHLRLERA